MATTLNAGISSLDEAHGKRIAGDTEAALRICLTLVEADAGRLGAAALLTELLVDAGRTMVASEAALRLVDSFVRRGDLMSATTCVRVAGRAGEDGKALLGDLARWFSRDSALLGDAAPAPPPLPLDVDVSLAVGALKGEALLDRGDAALSTFLAWDDSIVKGGELPRLPLFGSLSASVLERLLGAVRVRDVATDEVVAHQGDEGSQAFVVVRGMLEAVRDQPGGQRLTLAALGPGSIVGEMALVSDAPRAGSIVALEPTRLLVIKRETLEKTARREPALGEELAAFCRRRMVSNLVQHSAILNAVEPTARAALMSRFTTRSFQPQDKLVSQGQHASGLFLVASGGVDVLGRDEDGETLQVASLGPGDVVGEISLVLRRPATADVVATHHTVALELGCDAFQEAIADYPNLLNRLYELATKRDEELRTVVAQKALDVGDVVLL